jgi:hypothetical protein
MCGCGCELVAALAKAKAEDKDVRPGGPNDHDRPASARSDEDWRGWWSELKSLVSEISGRGKTRPMPLHPSTAPITGSAQ